MLAAPGAVADARRQASVSDARASEPAEHHAVSNIVYLERCVGGCTIIKGTADDARTNTSKIPQGVSPFSVQEYRNAAGQAGADADAEWDAFVQCMREVYSPYDVVVTDQRPMGGASYHLAVVAGSPGDVGLDSSIQGIGPISGDCSAVDNVVSFTFANAHGPADRVNTLCWTTAQQSAHAFGLDNEFEFLPDHRSSCSSPMSYRDDCGGQKFFRDETAACGEFAARPCHCGDTQNSHQKLLSVFGAGTPITGDPTSTITFPAAGAELGATVAATAGAKRGVAKVELIINGFKWAEVAGAPFGISGQPDPSVYTIAVPSTVPGGVIDLVARAYDDLGASTDSAVVRVMKGPPCSTEATCAAGQTCEDGKCLWHAAEGQFGEPCTYPQYCESMLCEGTAELRICTQPCDPQAADSCPTGFDCIATSPSDGVCFVGPMCGDGIISGSEACDDGADNADQPDHCRTSCQVPTCGDHIVDSNEQCDRGPGDDTCSATCLAFDSSDGGCCSTNRGVAGPIALGLFVLALVCRRRDSRISRCNGRTDRRRLASSRSASGLHTPRRE
ncbi:MAG: DUF4215 domain-containing protein [Kofleriaceae bacterium]